MWKRGERLLILREVKEAMGGGLEHSSTSAHTDGVDGPSAPPPDTPPSLKPDLRNRTHPGEVSADL